MKICGSQERSGSVKVPSRGAQGLASLSLQKVLRSTLIRRNYRTACPSEPSYQHYFPQARLQKALGISRGKVRPIFLLLELHVHTRVALEDVPLELQPNFSILVGSQKGKPFLSGLSATKENFLCQTLVLLEPEDALGSNNLL